MGKKYRKKRTVSVDRKPATAPVVAIAAAPLTPLQAKKAEQRIWIASSYMVLLLSVTYLIGVLWLFLMAGPAWAESRVVRVGSSIGAVVAPLSSVAGILLFDRLKKRLKRLLGHVIAPKGLLISSVILIAVAVVLSADLFGRLLSFHDANSVIDAASNGPNWKIETLDSAFNQFDEGSLAKSKYHDVYQAYAYSLAARQASDGQHQQQEIMLTEATTFGKPVLLRVVGHLGLANLYKAANVPTEATKHLEAARVLSHSGSLRLQSISRC
jgi:hypothetical protein